SFISAALQLRPNRLVKYPGYIENNPVRAKLVRQPEQWTWSSASAHIAGKNDRLVLGLFLQTR
ncbi:MAG: hypothetical protein R6U29_06515, partial [Desulfosudaceae bacterium]